jgi:hypothetical protein
MSFSRIFDACIVLCAMTLCSLLTQRTLVAADDTFFEKQVRPLLVQRCYKCHSGTKTNGSLALDSRAGWQRGGESGPAIIPGQPESSLLVQAINYDGLEMPPKEAGGKLSDAEIAILTKWVKRGANDPRIEAVRHGGMSSEQARSWWAFQSLSKTGSLMLS